MVLKMLGIEESSIIIIKINKLNCLFLHSEMAQQTCKFVLIVWIGEGLD